MTEREFDLMDELYFVISIQELISKLGWERQEIETELNNLIEKNWVKLICKNSKLEEKEVHNPIEFSKYEYLATKKGLLAHNSRD